MADEEGARQTGFFIVVYKMPDVCKTPMGSATPPVPYAIVADLSAATGVSGNVNFTGCPAFMLSKSLVPKADGDNAGTAGGVKSGTFLDECQPKEASKTFRVNKAFVVRQGDPFWMNKKNTEGVLIFLGPSAAGCGIGADRSPKADTSPPVKTTEKEEGLAKKVGDWWEQSKKEMGEAVDHPWEGVKGAAKGIGNIPSDVTELAVKGQLYQQAIQQRLAAGALSSMGFEDAANVLVQQSDEAIGTARYFSMPKFEMSNAAQAGGDKIATAIQLLWGGAGLLKKAPGLLARLGGTAAAAGDAALAADAARVEQAVAGTEKALVSTEKAVASTEKAVASTEKAVASTEKAAASTEKAAASTEKAAASTEKGAAKGKGGAKVTKAPPGLREKYLGRTPGKASKTGKEVIERMKAEGTVRDGPNGLEFKSAKDGEWYPLDQADMAHKTDAVQWWNETGRYYGAKAPEVRSWMLDSNNYYLEHFSYNRSAGASLGIGYLPPVPGGH